MLWDRGTWESDDPERGFKKGDLKFILHGDKLHGSWVLVRMKGDRYGGKRTNWLLIKHRDEYAEEGEANDILEEDRSVASGRTMAQIAQGKGKAPKPFMLAKGKTKADAVWHSNRGDAADARAGRKTAALRATPETRTRAPAQSAKPKKVSAMPDFVAPQLCASVERPPNADGWCHEIKFDGYRVQLRIEDGEVALLTRKGLDWAGKFGALARAAKALPDALIDGEIVALDDNGVPSFSALQAAIADNKTGELIFFAFDLLFANGEDLRALPLRERKERLKRLLERRNGKEKLIRYVDHFEDRGDTVHGIGQETGAGRHRLQETGCALPLGTHGELDQGQDPRRAGGRARRLEDHQRQIPFADGRRLSRRSSGLRRHGRYRLRPGCGPAHHAGVEGGGVRQKPVRRQGCAEEDPRRALAEARIGCRGRVRRLDRWRQHQAGRVQGVASGQAGKGDTRGEARHDPELQSP